MAQDPEAVRRFVADAAARLGISLNELSRRIGMNTSYMHQYLMRKSPKVLPEHVRPVLAQVLSVPVEKLVAERKASPSSAPQHRQPAGPRAGAIRDVPLYKAGMGVWQDDNDPAAYVHRPERLVGVPEAYAIRIPTDALKPGWRTGDTVFFSPADPPSEGDLVCVTRDGKRMIGLLRFKADGSFVIVDTDGRELMPIDSDAQIAREVAVNRR